MPIAKNPLFTLFFLFWHPAWSITTLKTKCTKYLTRKKVQFWHLICKSMFLRKINESSPKANGQVDSMEIFKKTLILSFWYNFAFPLSLFKFIVQCRAQSARVSHLKSWAFFSWLPNSIWVPDKMNCSPTKLLFPNQIKKAYILYIFFPS